MSVVHKHRLLLYFVIQLLGLVLQTKSDCDNCRSCFLQRTCLTCDERYYSVGSRCERCLENCAYCKSLSTCDKCLLGFYGSLCEQLCGIGCTDGYCDRYGLCSCKENYTGEKCDHCVAGKFGDQCQSSCQNCVCDDKTGHCTSCEKGYYLSGNVCKICENGTWGVNCKSKCPDRCSVCKPDDGTCVVCSDGKYSPNCSHECSPDCMARNGVPICAGEDGACTHGCSSSNKFGKLCNKNCPTNCRDGKCDWISGNCSNGCARNSFGELCDNFCSVSCAASQSGSSCEQESGTCAHGCIPGYYGSDCSLKCNSRCGNTGCDRHSGQCLHECIDGSIQEYCNSSDIDSSSSSDSSSLSMNTGAVIGAFVGVAFAVLVIGGSILLAVICLRRRKRRTESFEDTRIVQNNDNKSDIVEEISPEYAEVTETETDDATKSPVRNEGILTYENQLDNSTNQNVCSSEYEQLQDRDKSEQQYEMVSTTIYENTSR